MGILRAVLMRCSRAMWVLRLLSIIDGDHDKVLCFLFCFFLAFEIALLKLGSNRIFSLPDSNESLIRMPYASFAG
jgi:hypothetical protein